MKTFKVIEKPSGIFGITFEDFAIIMVVIFGTLFPLNLIKVWIEIPKWLMMSSYALIIATYIVLRRVNKKKVPGYLLSWIAYKFLSPRKIYIDKRIEVLESYDKKEKKQVRKGSGGRNTYSHH